MKIIRTNNDELLDLLVENNVSFEYNSDMNLVISDSVAELIPTLVKNLAPSTTIDYTIEPLYTYDVVFNDDYNSNNKGIRGTYNECMNWITSCRRDDTSYFGDYKGGTVSIVCIETEEYVYSEEIE